MRTSEGAERVVDAQDAAVGRGWAGWSARSLHEVAITCARRDQQRALVDIPELSRLAGRGLVETCSKPECIWGAANTRHERPEPLEKGWATSGAARRRYRGPFPMIAFPSEPFTWGVVRFGDEVD